MIGDMSLKYLLLLVSLIPLQGLNGQDRSLGESDPRQRLLDASRNAGFNPIVIDEFDAMAARGEHFPWQAKVPCHYIFAPSSGMVYGLAADRRGNLHMAVRPGVRRITKSGAIESLIPIDDANIGGIKAIAVSCERDIVWVATDGCIYILEDGRPRLVAGEPGIPMFHRELRAGQGRNARIPHIYSIASMDRDSIIVGCPYAVCQCDVDGDFRILSGGAERGYRDGVAANALFGYPRAVRHPEGGVWIVDSRLRLLRNGVVSTVAPESVLVKGRTGTPPVPPLKVQFAKVRLLATDARDSLYMTEVEAVMKVDTAGSVSVLMGSPGRRYARVWGITAIAVDDKGNLFTAHQEMY